MSNFHLSFVVYHQGAEKKLTEALEFWKPVLLTIYPKSELN